MDEYILQACGQEFRRSILKELQDPAATKQIEEGISTDVSALDINKAPFYKMVPRMLWDDLKNTVCNPPGTFPCWKWIPNYFLYQNLWSVWSPPQPVRAESRTTPPMRHVYSMLTEISKRMYRAEDGVTYWLFHGDQ